MTLQWCRCTFACEYCSCVCEIKGMCNGRPSPVKYPVAECRIDRVCYHPALFCWLGISCTCSPAPRCLLCSRTSFLKFGHSFVISLSVAHGSRDKERSDAVLELRRGNVLCYRFVPRVLSSFEPSLGIFPWGERPYNSGVCIHGLCVWTQKRSDLK